MRKAKTKKKKYLKPINAFNKRVINTPENRNLYILKDSRSRYECTYFFFFNNRKLSSLQAQMMYKAGVFKHVYWDQRCGPRDYYILDPRLVDRYVQRKIKEASYERAS